MIESSGNPGNAPRQRRENPQNPLGSAPKYPYQQPPYPNPVGRYPPPPQQPYYGYPPPAVLRNGLGITSLVLAVVALVSVWSVFGGVVLGIVAVVTGFLGWRRVKRRQANNGAIAIAGIVLGSIAVVVGLVFIAVWVALWEDTGGDNYFDCLQNAGPDHGRQQQCADQFRDKVQDRFGVTLTTPSPVP